MLYKSINKYQKQWVYIENKSKHNIGLLYFCWYKKNYITLNNRFIELDPAF
ncbi:hypothetical protein HYD43_03915 [Mycoplasmopsis bovis]|nr:hypothetical protein [Mycoplasmopsis bovis]QQH84080.1 hypothetical protein HYD43_03915 [Mycoplasmopsis bovis]